MGPSTTQNLNSINRIPPFCKFSSPPSLRVVYSVCQSHIFHFCSPVVVCRMTWRRFVSGVVVSPIVISARFAATLPRANSNEIMDERGKSCKDGARVKESRGQASRAKAVNISWYAHVMSPTATRTHMNTQTWEIEKGSCSIIVERLLERRTVKFVEWNPLSSIVLP